jgi:hypothetical protein
VGPDGTIYKASALGKAGYGTLFAINSDGTQKWSWDTSADDLYCGGSTYLIYCSIESTPALAPNGTLYVKPYGQGVIAINSQMGQYLWRNNFSDYAGGADPFGQSLSVGSDSVAYTSEGGGRYNFYAVNPNNTIKWVTKTAVWNDEAVSPISADGALVLRGDNAANFYAFDTSDGSIWWKLSTLSPSGAILGAPVLSANGIIYFTTGETTATPPGTPGYVFAVRVDTGEIVWQYQVGFPDADLAMGSDGTLYVPGQIGASYGLYAFQCADGVCALPKPTCPDPTNITTEEDLSTCIQLANMVDGPQTLGLGADITLHTRLPISSEIVINGNGRFISGDNAVQVFHVRNPGNLTLNAITVQNGSAGYGGGINNSGGMVVVTNSTFSGNTVNYGYGGGIFNSGTITVINSTFSDNLAAYGGGIFNFGTMTTANSTFSRNTANYGYGGGILNSGTITVVNNTFSDNSIAWIGDGGGIYNSGVLHLKNSILANSTDEYGITVMNDCYSEVALASDSHNLIESTLTCGLPVSSADPKLGPLANNGGSTNTFALLAGSPALDAGDDAVCAAVPVNNLDQRGITRPQGAHCDIGAHEFVVIQTTHRVYLPLISRP